MYIPHKIITCADCGCELLALAPNQLRCKECQKENLRRYHREHKKPKKRKPEHKPEKIYKPESSNHAEIAELEREGRTNGMSYGQYVAQGRG